METPRGLIREQFGAETREDCGIFVLVELILCPFVSVDCSHHVRREDFEGKRTNKHAKGRRLQPGLHAIVNSRVSNALLEKFFVA
jgi:hypothetical protein